MAQHVNLRHLGQRRWRLAAHVIRQRRSHITDLSLPVDHEVQVFYIIQEALANVARHSGAKHARLTMELAGGEYRFTVEDDGLGFYAFGQPLEGAEQHAHLRHHLGVNIMRERAQHLDGRIEISNLPQGGARVSLVFSAQRGAGE